VRYYSAEALNLKAHDLSFSYGIFYRSKNGLVYISAIAYAGGELGTSLSPPAPPQPPPFHLSPWVSIPSADLI